MSTRLKCRFAFGYAPNVKNGIHFTAKDEAVVHPAGHGVAIAPISKDKPKQYISGSSTSTGISAIAMSNDKELISVAENSTKGFIVNVFDMNKPEEPIESLDGSEDEPEILSLSFTSDKSRILTLSGKKSDKVSMSMWNWKGGEEKTKKRVVRSKSKVYKDETILHLSCGTNPEDRAVCSLVGGSVVKVFRAVEQDEIFHPIIGAKTPSYSNTIYGDAVCHSWAKSGGRFFVGTSKGNVVLIESGEILGVVKCTRDIAVPIHSIFVTGSGGLMCGCAKSTLIRVVPKESKVMDPLESFELKDTRLVANATCDLHSVATSAHDLEAMKSSCLELYSKYVNRNKEDIDTKMMDENVQKECERQKTYMKKSIRKLKQDLASEAECQKSENRKHIKENMELIKEIAELRKKIKGLKFGVKGVGA